MNEMELQTTLDPIEMDMGDPEVVYSPVFPNPEGEPTDDLTKVQIQGDIYKVKDPEVHDWARAEEKPTYTKDEVGLGNVDDTSDMDKPVSTATQTALDNKVDKIEGKGLSEEDFTHTLKSKLDGIQSGAEVNVQSDFAQSDNSADDFIKNKPTKLSDFDNDEGFIDKSVNDLENYYKKSETYTKTEINSALNGKADKSDTYTKSEVNSALENKVDKDGDKVLSDNNYSDTDKTKLDGIEANANHTEVDTEISSTSENPLQNKAIYDLLNDLLPEGEATGNPITITNASGFNAKALTVDMLPIQAGSGTPSPDNVRPISGRTSLDVTVNGETETLNLGQTVYGGTCDVVGGGTSDEWEIVNVTSAENIKRNNAKQYYIRSSIAFEVSSTNIVSNKFKTASSGNGVCFLNQNGNIRFNTVDEYESAEALFNAIGNIQFVAKLATPTTLTTPATPISLNKGNNTLSTSGDNMDLKYSTIISNPTSLSMGNPLSLSRPNLQTVAEPEVEEPTEE